MVTNEASDIPEDGDEAWGRHRKLTLSEAPRRGDDDDDDDLGDDVDGGASQAPRRARRRPRAAHVSTPPMPVDDGAGPDEPRAGKAAKKKPTKKARKGKVTDRHASLPFEVAGISLFAVDVLLALSLLSYSSQDRTPGRPVDNWIGPGGAYVADVLTLTVGVAAFVVPAVLLLVAVACFRPVQHKAHATLRGMAALVAALSAMTLAHLMLRGTDLLPFPAGGLVGGLLADAGAQRLAPLGTGVVSAALCFVGVVVALDRPVGGTARSLIDSVIDGWHAATEQLAVWREERRLLAEEAARLDAEDAASDPPAPSVAEAERDRRRDREEKAQARQQRIAEQAKARADEKIAELRASRVATAAETDDGDDEVVIAAPPPKPPTKGNALKAPAKDPGREPAKQGPVAFAPATWATMPAAPAAPVAATLEQQTVVESDPPWARELDDGVVLSLADAMKKAKRPATAAAAPTAGVFEPLPSMIIEDEDLKIVERAANDAATIVAEAEREDEVCKEEERAKKEFVLPPLNLLDYDAPQLEPIDESKLRAQADKLIAKFLTFGIEGRVREIRPGPVVTTYEFVPAPGIKVSKIAALADDIAMAMEAIHVRIVAPIPGKGAVGIEIPNEKRETVYMKEIIADPAFKKRDEKLLMALGKDIDGKSYYANLADMPHVLVAGTTGSGKSVSVNAMICSILYRATPEDVRFMMIDPKMLELSLYDGIPHLLLPPIIDSKKAAVALKWAVAEMERRYQLMSDVGVRDLKGFNEKVLAANEPGSDGSVVAKLRDKDGRALQKLPYIVIIIDEYADLLAVAGKDVEGYVMRIAQKARAAGLHVMLATQRPSVDVITGVIKANFPVRMGFRLASSHDSKTIINQPGAEKLLGRGDMLFMPPGTSNVSRVHGAFLSEKELHKVVAFLKEQGKPNYDMSILTYQDEAEGGGGGSDVDLSNEPKDPKYDEAIQLVARTKKCSTSYVQRMMNIGYQRAARIVDRMEKEGLVGPQLNTKGDRDIYMRPDGSVDAASRTM